MLICTGLAKQKLFIVDCYVYVHEFVKDNVFDDLLNFSEKLAVQEIQGIS